MSSELAAKEGWGEALRADRQSALRGGGGVETAGRRAQKMPSISCSESRRCCQFRTEIRPSIPCSQSRKCCHFRTEISPGGGIEITGGGVKIVMSNHKGAPRSWGHKGQSARKCSKLSFHEGGGGEEDFRAERSNRSKLRETALLGLGSGARSTPTVGTCRPSPPTR